MDMKKFVEEVTNGINYLGFNPREFCQQMSKQHRSLQATFTHMCVEWLEFCADMMDKQLFDERNEYEVRIGAYLAKQLLYFHIGSQFPIIRTVYGSLTVEPVDEYHPLEDAVGDGWLINFEEGQVLVEKLTAGDGVHVRIVSKDGSCTDHYLGGKSQYEAN